MKSLVVATAIILTATAALAESRMHVDRVSKGFGFRTAYVHVNTGRWLHVSWQKNLPTEVRVTSNKIGIVASKDLIADQREAVELVTGCKILYSRHDGQIMYATTQCNGRG